MNHTLPFFPASADRQTYRQADHMQGRDLFVVIHLLPQSAPSPAPLLLLLCRPRPLPPSWLTFLHLLSCYSSYISPFSPWLPPLPTLYPPPTSTSHARTRTHKSKPHSCFPSDIDKWRLTEMTTSLLIFNSDTSEDREKREAEGE